jgi:hypothetical protein
MAYLAAVSYKLDLQFRSNTVHDNGNLAFLLMNRHHHLKLC